MDGVDDLYLDAVRAEIRAELAATLTDRASLARDIDVSKATISRYLSGEREMPLGVFLRIVYSFDLDVPGFWERVERRMDTMP